MVGFFDFFCNFAKKKKSKQERKHSNTAMNITNDYRRELKSKIIEYAMNEFRQRGIKAVKMDEISRGLHVSKRTVYEIFGDKEELLLAGIRAQNEELRRMLDQFASENNHNVIDIICYFYRVQMELCEQVGVKF